MSSSVELFAKTEYKRRFETLILQYHVTLLSNFLFAFDKYSKQYDKSKIPQSSYPGLFFLLDRENISIGIAKYSALLDKLNQPHNRLIVIETWVEKADLNENNRTGTGLGRYIESNIITVNAVYEIDSGQLIKAKIEDIVADAYQHIAPSFNEFRYLKPRSVSILPIAKGCQASCSFCFSNASLSRDVSKRVLSRQTIEFALRQAKQAGAERAVITGGGEPGLMPIAKLVDMIKQCRRYFSKVVLISNGYFVSNAAQPDLILEKLANAGLSVLSISHHHNDSHINKAIMNLDVSMEIIAQSAHRIRDKFPDFKLRLIAVLQQSGIANSDDIDTYMHWASKLGVTQICFKELYVSSSRESYYFDKEANNWSYENQVSLRIVTQLAEQENWSLSHRLPWGSPVYRLKLGEHILSVAAYTEPSVSWELKNGICRSWNLMADGRCFASLETSQSELQLLQ